MSKVQSKVDQQISKIEFLFNFIKEVDKTIQVDDTVNENKYLNLCEIESFEFEDETTNTVDLTKVSK